MLLVQYLTSDPSAPPNNLDQAALRVDAQHRLYVTSAGSTGAFNLTQVGGAAIALGQTTMSASLPVTIASNQTGVPVTGTFWQTTQPVSLASLPSLAAGSNVIGGVTQSGTWTVTNNTTNANLYTGQQTVSTTQVQVTSSSNTLVNGLYLKALSSNSANIYVGLTGVTTSTGDVLEPGEGRLYAVNNTNLLYIISVASTTDKVSYEGN